jgi:MinD-like ATPase involved in chromosome partitioning or flagellar assembly
VSSLVIVCSSTADGARQAAVTMNWLGQNGYHHLRRRSCVVINHLVPVKPQIDVLDLGHQYERLVGQGRVVLIRWDAQVAAGGKIRLDQVSRKHRRKIVELAAARSGDFISVEGPVEAGAARHPAHSWQRPGFAGATAPAHSHRAQTSLTRTGFTPRLLSER